MARHPASSLEKTSPPSRGGEVTQQRLGSNDIRGAGQRLVLASFRP
jgi:hypothetical protein